MNPTLKAVLLAGFWFVLGHMSCAVMHHLASHGEIAIRGQRLRALEIQPVDFYWLINLRALAVEAARVTAIRVRIDTPLPLGPLESSDWQENRCKIRTTKDLEVKI